MFTNERYEYAAGIERQWDSNSSFHRT